MHYYCKSCFMKEFLMGITLEQCHQLVIEAYSNTGGLEMAKAILTVDPSSNNQPPQGCNWCICGRCRVMPTAIENKCCRKRVCITTTESFHSIVLDTTILSVALVSRGDDIVERVTYTPASYRKTAYRQFIMWEHGFLGRSVRRVNHHV